MMCFLMQLFGAGCRIGQGSERPIRVRSAEYWTGPSDLAHTGLSGVLLLYVGKGTPSEACVHRTGAPKEGGGRGVC